WGVLGGALGFPLGQSLQAFHAWNAEMFHSGLWLKIDPLINWWNFMETTFGATMGAVLGLGLWLNRHRIAPLTYPPPGAMPFSFEWVTLAIHLALLVAAEFFSFAPFDTRFECGFTMGVIPILCVAAGRWWPYLLALPIVAVPIAGKTLRQLAYHEAAISPWLG